MDCQDAQNTVIESIIEPLSAERQIALHDHLADCQNCSRFAEAQIALDAQLSAAIQSPLLSPRFRIGLQQKIRADAALPWRDSLPDIAHLVGGAIATVVSALLLSQYSETIFLAGFAFTGVTYFLQAVLRDSLESSDDGIA